MSTRVVAGQRVRTKVAAAGAVLPEGKREGSSTVHSRKYDVAVSTPGDTPPSGSVGATGPAGPGRGDQTHQDQDLLARVYEQLRAQAQKQMNTERVGHTLTATALVNEAYLRLLGPRRIPFAEEAHFYVAAAQAMRRILIDHARAKGARGGPAAQLTGLPDVESLADRDPEQILAVDAAVTRLEGEDPEAAAIVRLRFYAGLSVDQAAEALGISPRSAARLWSFARATLHRMLSERDG